MADGPPVDLRIGGAGRAILNERATDRGGNEGQEGRVLL
jgi:hypothetical protein